ncbi:hypothetical protein GLAREA_09839 [Glarea lozoyensis ATCC 20868]|uniref:Uncharacterized protein n=1 Tax=Glarea lozoyensis (strain ATCC 20868 / MF5171) TaxID=1116229 RepID=S3DQG4_GLAL2|nr:uncharacterized protein GLAREA_09839 [Glarea lozoyensis ATCC 20868]EPE28718.1 hypothetical protein GLAREA_09839 [Glarea lozoyensis ATCC 20868]
MAYPRDTSESEDRRSHSRNPSPQKPLRRKRSVTFADPPIPHKSERRRVKRDPVGKDRVSYMGPERAMKYLEEQEEDSYGDVESSLSSGSSSGSEYQYRPVYGVEVAVPGEGRGGTYGSEREESTRSTYVRNPETGAGGRGTYVRGPEPRDTYVHESEYQKHRGHSLGSSPESEAERRRRHRRVIDDQIIREAQKTRMRKRNDDQHRYQSQKSSQRTRNEKQPAKKPTKEPWITDIGTWCAILEWACVALHIAAEPRGGWASLSKGRMNGAKVGRGRR